MSQGKAHGIVLKAIADGVLTRPNTCELCGATPDPIIVNHQCGKTLERPAINAHHHNGYDDPLDVWWICTSCNSKMMGYPFHCGRFTKEEIKSVLHLTRQGIRKALGVGLRE